MARTMYDAVTVSAIPDGSVLVAGYVNGSYANLSGLRARFPHALVVGVTVTAGADEGQVLDVESGDASPAEAPGWVERRRAAGADPTVYCNASTWPAVRAAFSAAGVAAPHFWIADYDGDPAIPAGAVAKQYASNENYDASAVAAYWPGVDPTPEDTMLLTAQDQAVIKEIVTTVVAAAISANRGQAVSDDLYWFAAAVDGQPPTGAPAVDVASIKTLHAALAAPAAQAAANGAALTALTAKVGALQGAIGALAAGGGITAAQLTAAAEAGATAALAELGHVLVGTTPAATTA
ncbi:hypothetical protein [Streptacidiphilus albus]|uniref:hypothetical protein n=1 Tax=Streptacidiphilus albus TaxID=105425 RepID=UPI00068CAC97|nr:hypothetical protein [Streptacidiphilus albus]